MWASDAANGFTALKTAMDAGTAVTVMFSTEVSGDKKYSGSAYITDIGIDAADDDNAVFDVSFEGTGALTEGTVGT
jgi:predicted secreted protein